MNDIKPCNRFFREGFGHTCENCGYSFWQHVKQKNELVLPEKSIPFSKIEELVKKYDLLNDHKHGSMFDFLLNDIKKLIK